VRCDQTPAVPTLEFFQLALINQGDLATSFWMIGDCRRRETVGIRRDLVPRGDQLFDLIIDLFSVL
jgi:hypothetical protein